MKYFYQRVFPDISSPDNIWNMSDDKSDEEESSSNDYTEYSDNVSFFISKLWIERGKRINNNYAVTGWMLCVIPNIREYFFINSNINHMNQVNTVHWISTAKPRMAR